MATIQNARDTLLQAAGVRLETVAGPTNVTTDFANVTGVTRPSNNADVTQSAVNSGVTASSGGITLSSGGSIKGGQTAYDSGNGFFVGYEGGAYKVSVGNSSGNKFTWNGTTLAVVGDITGSSGTFGGTTDFANVTGSTRPSNNADVTQTAVNSGVTATSGGITLSSGGAIKGGQTAYDSGNGFFLGYSSSTYRFSVGNSSGSKLTWDGSALGVVGDISGTSNIDITGNARFKGAYTGAVTNAAVYSNESNTAATGVFGTSSATLASHAATGIGVWGVGTGAEAFGVVGGSTGGIGVSGATASGSSAGVRGNNTGGGPSVECVTTFKWNGYTYSAPTGSTSTYMRNDGTWATPAGATAGNQVVKPATGQTITLSGNTTGASTATFNATNKPGSNSGNEWLTVNIDGTNYYVPIWT